MKHMSTATLAVILAASLSVHSAEAGYAVPGETMGVSLISPLPEGVYFADLETYGRTDAQPAANLGVNIPVVIWSTPYSFYNTRLEFALALPFAHLDGTVNTTAPVTWAVGPLFAHDFGNGLTGGLGALFRSPSPNNQFAQTVDGRTVFETDFRQSLQYKYTGFGPFGDVTFIENAFYTTALGNSSYRGVTSGGALVQNDFFAGDFAIEKSFDKFTIGFTGFGNIDTDNRNFAGRASNVELGGLVGYDFGKFSLTGIVTRTVLTQTAGVNNGAYETRGWMRLILPLYVAPTAPVVSARY